MQLIDRDSIPNYKIWGMATVGNSKHPTEMRIVMWDDLMKMPVVTPNSLAVHGKWVDAGRGIKACSRCNHGIREHMSMVNHYCPNCGACMDLEEQSGV